MSKYRTSPIPDLGEIIDDLERRISKLERTPQLESASIDGGELDLLGANFVTKTIDEPQSNPLFFEKGIIEFGSDMIVAPAGSITFHTARSQSVESNDPAFPGFISTRFSNDDNAVPKVRTIEIFDKNGSYLLSDSQAARQGMSDPTLCYQWSNPNSYSTTTSGTFAGFAQTFWYQYHPHLLIEVVANNPASTTSEIQIVDLLNGSAVLDLVTGPAGAVTNIELVVARSAMQNGNFPNGNLNWVEVQHRRASGAGTCSTRVLQMVGIDKSLTDPF